MNNSKIKTLIIAVTLLVVPFSLRAQPVEYRSNQGALVGTSDSRMFVTVQEAADHVEFKVSLLGELTARSIDFILLYDPDKLRLTDETCLHDIPDGFGAGNFNSPVVTIPASFSSRFPDHTAMPRRHRAVFSGNGAGMKYFVSELINILPASLPVYLMPGEVIHAYSIYCRKVNPGTPVISSDFGYYAQIQQATPEPIPVQASYWTYDACQIRYAQGMSGAQAYFLPKLFTYRSPSYVTTEKVTNIQATAAVLNATFKRGDLPPKNNMIASSYWVATYYGHLNWDSVVHRGFIYSNTDADMLVDGYSDKLIIDGAVYNFPDETELASGTFVRNGKTFYINQQNNKISAQAVSFSQNITGLPDKEKCYVWSFIQYTFETSDPLLFVGNKITFETGCGDPVVVARSEPLLSFCDRDEIYLFVEVEDSVQYQWYFNGDALPDETNSYYKSIFGISKEGEYAVKIYNECGTLTCFFAVKRNPTMIKMKWDDVIYVANSENIYVDYQWYKNGDPIAQHGKNQYYAEKGGFTPQAEYNVRAYKLDGTYDEACPIVPNIGKTINPGLTIYPNPTNSGSKITFLLHLPGEDAIDANACIYDMAGKTITQFKITNYLTEVTLNVAAGTYAVKVTTANGDEFADKIMIQK